MKTQLGMANVPTGGANRVELLVFHLQNVFENLKTHNVKQTQPIQDSIKTQPGMFLRPENYSFSICTAAFLDQSKLTSKAKTENKNVNSLAQVFNISFVS